FVFDDHLMAHRCRERAPSTTSGTDLRGCSKIRRAATHTECQKRACRQHWQHEWDAERPRTLLVSRKLLIAFWLRPRWRAARGRPHEGVEGVPVGSDPVRTSMTGVVKVHP